MTSNEKQNKILKSCLGNLEECAQLIENYFSGDERDTELETIKELAKGYYEIDAQRDLTIAALDLTNAYFSDDSKDHAVNVDEIYKQYAKDAESQIVPFNQHPLVAKVIIAVTAASQNQRKSINLDASLVCTQTTQLHVDPITKAELQNPWKNKICGHVYEHSVIVQYIHSKKSKPARCPYVGCSNANIKVVDLIEDEELARRIRNSTQATSSAHTSIQEID